MTRVSKNERADTTFDPVQTDSPTESLSRRFRDAFPGSKIRSGPHFDRFWLPKWNQNREEMCSKSFARGKSENIDFDDPYEGFQWFILPKSEKNDDGDGQKRRLKADVYFI